MFFKKKDKAASSTDPTAVGSEASPGQAGDGADMATVPTRDAKGEGLAPVTTTATEDIVYPSGIKLGLLLASIFISMFLVALVSCIEQVSADYSAE